MKKQEKNKKKNAQFNHIRRQIFKEKTPRVDMELAYRNKETGQITVVKDTVTPKSKFGQDKYEKLYEIATVQISEILKIHEAQCPNFKDNKIQLSCDGVHENKSTSVSIDVYSLAFKHCKQIYPYKLVRPLNSYKMDTKRHLSDTVNDITANKLRIVQYIADKLKRSDAKCCKGHSSWYPCEYCYAKGTKIEIHDNEKARRKLIDQIKAVDEQISQWNHEQITSVIESKINNLESLKKELRKSLNSLKRKSNILWPASTMNGEHRSRQSIQAIIEKIENDEILNIDESKGIIGRSVLFDVRDFNFVYDTPAEYLHSGCLGVVKKLVEMTFSVGINRPRVTKRKLSSTKTFNTLILRTKVTKEFPRRARNLDFATFKAQEYRNLSLFFSH